MIVKLVSLVIRSVQNKKEVGKSNPYGSPNWVSEYKTIDNRFYEAKSTECEETEPSRRRR